MNSIGQIRVDRGISKTMMLPTKNVRNGIQNSTKIMVENRCSSAEERRLDTRDHLAHTDDSDRIGVQK